MVESLETVAIIPARGGSVGIPGKNLKKIGGVELIARSIRAATAARRVDRVVVSTDADDIAAVARREGAEVVERPAAISDSVASSESALVHALETLGLDTGTVVFLQCTSPFTTAEMIDDTVALVDGDHQSALTVAPSHRFLWRQLPDGGGDGINHDKSIRLRRQDMEPEYVETGAVYAIDIPLFLEHRHRFVGSVGLNVTDAERADEIDDPEDLERCRALARKLDAAMSESTLREIRAVAFDFDGVFTDDRVLVDQHGVESVFCSRGDGMGLSMLRELGFGLVVLSKERNPVVLARCEKLGIEAFHAVDDKIGALEAWAERESLSLDQIVFVGNDVNDVECLEAAALGFAPADAHPSARESADRVLDASGGRGAIRELADLLVRANPR